MKKKWLTRVQQYMFNVEELQLNYHKII